MPSSQGVTNLSSRGPGAVIRRAVTHEAKAARQAPATGAQSAIPLAMSLLTTRLLRSVPPTAWAAEPEYKVPHLGGANYRFPERMLCAAVRETRGSKDASHAIGRIVRNGATKRH